MITPSSFRRRITLGLVSSVATLSLGVACHSLQTASGAQATFFENRVRPILAERCYPCHSELAKEPKGGLLLDSKVGLTKGGKHGPVVMSGDPAASRLIRAIGHDDASLRMPPSGKLQPAEIAALTTWVRDGAYWSEAIHPARPAPSNRAAAFWAFVPPKSPPLPAVRNVRWSQGALDRFVLAGLERKGLQPAPPVDRMTLIRRATLDLTGLPPTMAEVRDFVGDRRPGAFERVIDRLLASSAFGECWGRHWLDVARYADSNGVDENLVYTQAWRYRDYVIRAFNQDKPIDRFFSEQLAGDLLPESGGGEPNYDPIIATGFLSLGPKMLAEDDPVKQEMDLIDEQVDTLGKVFMGMTLGCARCHDHKFDPIPQTDYYALASIFKSTKTMLNYKNMAEWQEIALAPKADAEKLAKIEAEIAALKHTRETMVKAGADLLMADLKARAAEYRSAAADLLRLEKGPPLQPVFSAEAGQSPPGVRVVEAEDFVQGNVLKDTTGFGKGIGVLVNAGTYPNRVEYSVALPAAGIYQLDLRYASGDPRPIRVFINSKLVASNAAGKVTGGFYPDAQRWMAEGLFIFRAGKNEIVFERDSYFPHIDKFALTPRPGAVPVKTPEQLALERKLVPGLLVSLAEKVKSANRSELEEQDLELPDNPEPLLSAEQRAELKKLDESIAAVQKTRQSLPRAMAVSEGAPVDLKVHLRGNYLTLGTQCARGFPAVLSGHNPPVIPKAHSGRLELAEWITRADHPLTARVFVNRVWRWLFGAGIVKSVDNFGALGEKPSNPALLDWMATSFVKDGWSLKRLIKSIMLSATYQQSSRYDEHAALIDPENRLLWRHSPRRLDAEAIRDSLLASSGLLDRTMEGTLLTFRDREYVTSTANSDPVKYTSSRRSVYLPVVRSALYDVYTAFDFGDPTVMNGDRPVTTVAPQALFMMNSSLVLDASKKLAESILRGSEQDDTARVARLYEACLSRTPTSAETKRALKYLQQLDIAYAADVQDAQARRAKVWQSVCKSIMASSEFIYVN